MFCEKIETLTICHRNFNKKRNMDNSDLKNVYSKCGLGF